MSYFRNQQGQTGSTPYEFSPLGNQILPNNINNNEFSNGANHVSSFNNLNLSTRAPTVGASNPSSLSNLNNSSTNNGQAKQGFHQNTNIYPTSRATNISPSLNFASLYSNRARFNASKGFDLEDDLEFCPEIHEHYQSSHSTNLGSGNSSFTHHKFNPYTASTFSPQVSPTSANALTASPTTSKPSISSTTPKSDYTNHTRNITPRAKKVLEIVNPITGLRVTSPAPYK